MAQAKLCQGIIVMRQNENALQVIERVKAKMRQIEPGLPVGIRSVPIYDRSQLIYASIDTLKTTLIEVIFTIAIVIFVFLRHFPSAVIPIVTIPITILIAAVPFHALGMTTNIMSLGGVIIAIGTLVDAAIIVVEQTHKRLEQWEESGSLGNGRDVILQAVKEVGGPSFFTLLVIAVSFLPVS